MRKSGVFFKISLIFWLIFSAGYGNDVLATDPPAAESGNRMTARQISLAGKQDTTATRQSFLENIPATGKYMASMSFGLLPGSSKLLPLVPVSLMVSQGVLNPSGIYIGLCAGVETFQPAILPLEADFRYMMVRRRNVHPWIGTRIGYSIALNSAYTGWSLTNYKGGAAFGVGGGVSYDINPGSSVWFYAGYRFQKLTEKTEEQDNMLKYNRVEVRLGISLH